MAIWKGDETAHMQGMFASYLLIGRRGIVTTNAVEQFNNVMLETRESPISDALLMLMNKSAQQTVHRKQQGMKWKEEGMKIVPNAHETYVTNLTEGLTRQAVIIKYPSENDPLAQVDVSSGSVLNVNSTNACHSKYFNRRYRGMERFYR